MPLVDVAHAWAAATRADDPAKPRLLVLITEDGQIDVFGQAAPTRPGVVVDLFDRGQEATAALVALHRGVHASKARHFACASGDDEPGPCTAENGALVDEACDALTAWLHEYCGPDCDPAPVQAPDALPLIEHVMRVQAERRADRKRPREDEPAEGAPPAKVPCPKP